MLLIIFIYKCYVQKNIEYINKIMGRTRISSVSVSRSFILEKYHFQAPSAKIKAINIIFFLTYLNILVFVDSTGF